jgi:hypothetical protein
MELPHVGQRYGRDAGYPTPPVQTRTCSFPASGSSVALASVQGKTLFAKARREVGSSDSGPTCPGGVSFPGGVLPSRRCPRPGCRHPDPASQPDMTLWRHPAPQQRGVCPMHHGDRVLGSFSACDHVGGTVAGCRAVYARVACWACHDRLQRCRHQCKTIHKRGSVLLGF